MKIKMNTLLADICVSVTELKRNLVSVLRAVASAPVVILNHNQPTAYLLSAEYYESLLEKLEDLEDARLVKERRSERVVKVSVHE